MLNNFNTFINCSVDDLYNIIFTKNNLEEYVQNLKKIEKYKEIQLLYP